MITGSSLNLLAALALVGCDAGVAPAPVPVSAPATVTLTSVAFADDCGGTPPSNPPVMPAARRAPGAVPEKAAADQGARRCEQTSMQLAIVATRDTEVRVKSVEVFDEHGTSLGVLTTRTPTRWGDAQATYQPWDEKVAAGQTARVSYVLQQPSFVSEFDARDRTYTVKVHASVGGIDQPLQTTVMVVGRPPPVPT